jgi:hypothetical protein
MAERNQPSPEAPREQEKLLALGRSFATDVQSVQDLKFAIIGRAIGPEPLRLHLLDLEMQAESEEALAETRRAGQSREEALFEQYSVPLEGFETESLDGARVGFNSDRLRTSVQNSEAEHNKRRSRYTEYYVRDGLLAADHHDYYAGETTPGERRAQMELERAAGVNSQPVSLGQAEYLALMLHSYRSQLENLLGASDHDFRTFFELRAEDEDET